MMLHVSIEKLNVSLEYQFPKGVDRGQDLKKAVAVWFSSTKLQSALSALLILCS